MTDKEIIFDAMKKRDYNKTILAKEMGYATHTGVTERLRGKQAMRCDTFVKYLEKMGFEVVVRSKRADKSEWVLSYPKNSEADS